jgi:hypothetical protein
VVDGRGGRGCGGEVGGGGVERGCCEGGQLEMEDRIGGIVIDGGATCLAGAAATYGEPPAACLPQRSGSALSPALCCKLFHQTRARAPHSLLLPSLLQASVRPVTCRRRVGIIRRRACESNAKGSAVLLPHMPQGSRPSAILLAAMCAIARLLGRRPLNLL